VALLGSVACVLNAAAFSDCLRDEIDFRGGMFAIDLSRPLPVAAYLARRAGEGDPPWRRARKLLSLATQTGATSRDIALHCGELLDLGPAIKQALGQCDEHWDGKYAVLGLKGEEISLPARLFLIAQDIDVHYRAGGVDGAVAVVRQRSGKLYDPRIAEIFCKVAPSLLSRLDTASAWDAMLAAEPAPVRVLSPDDLGDVLHKVADFVDMRSPYTVGHSPAVAALAENAAHAFGLSAADATNLRNAGLIHDLGRAGVPVTAWNKREALNAQEWERMRQHAALTELVVARSTSLGLLGTVAGLHHERLDGSGYRGVSAASLPVTARLLAAADAYETKLERRPHRDAMAPEGAAEYVRGQAAERKLDGDAVAAVLSAAGQPRTKRRGALPSGLSEREAEVLRLAVRGLTNREMAETLVVSPKTVGHHLESIYRKAGVSTRAGATIFALRHGLVGEEFA
jgi:HD-GYP domain-containing protein (c-di-GMP phosphodiesterase class II)